MILHSRAPFGLAALAALAFVTACGGDAPKPVSVFSPAPPAPGAAPAQPGASQPALQPGAPGAPATLPPGHPPIDPAASGGAPGGMAAALPPPPAGAGQGASELKWDVPKAWVVQNPSSAMRKAQYKVAGPGGDAECVVFYFGPGQGGDAQGNAARWIGQFRQADGKPAQGGKSETMKAGAIDVLTVEVKGTYVGGMGTGPSADQSGYMLLGAVAQGPDANWFFKFTGPEKTVEAQRAAFQGLLKSLKKGA